VNRSGRFGRMQRREVFVVIALAALAACGGSKPGALPTATPSTPAGSTSPSPRATPTHTTTPKPGKTSPSPTPGKTGKPTPRGTAGAATVTLSQTCTRRGVDKQTITFVTTPGDSVGYETTYSDGSTAPPGQGTGGAIEGNPFTDSDGSKNGHWSDTWTIPATAPTGLATVIATSSHGRVDLSFNIIGRTGRCP
jgi:hypothetical protein